MYIPDMYAQQEQQEQEQHEREGPTRLQPLEPMCQHQQRGGGALEQCVEGGGHVEC